MISISKAEEAEKRRYLPLLLLADEAEDMIDRYLWRGDLFVMEEDGETLAVAVVTDEGGGVCELQNLAVTPSRQRQGLGCAMVRYVLDAFRYRFDTMTVATGDSPLHLRFYRKNGFAVSHRLVNYITEHYDHPIYEDGVLLKDKVVLSQPLGHRAAGCACAPS